MITIKRKIGNLGEDIACEYLKAREYRILGRNYLKKWGEIDLIAEKDNVIHFVEVKSAQRPAKDCDIKDSFRVEENVHEAKLKRLWRTIETYLIEESIDEGKEWHIDVCVIEIDYDSKKAHVRFLENIIL